MLSRVIGYHPGCYHKQEAELNPYIFNVDFVLLKNDHDDLEAVMEIFHSQYRLATLYNLSGEDKFKGNLQVGHH